MDNKLSHSEILTISVLLQSAFYGFAVFMCGVTVFLLSTRDPFKRRASQFMIAASCTLILLATTVGIEFITNVVRLLRGFIIVGPGLPGGPEQFFFNLAEPTFLIKGCLYVFQILILDAVVIYRAYIAWGCSYYAIAVPCVGWCGLLASTIGVIRATFVRAKHPSTQSILANWVVAMYSITLVTNFTATGLLAYRIWRTNRKALAFGASTGLGLVFRVVVESGAIYAVLNLVLVTANRVGSPVAFFVRDILPPIVPIVFNMLIVQVRFAASRKLSVFGIESTFQTPTLPKIATPSEPWQLSPYPTRRDNGSGLRSLAVELTQFLETNLDVSPSIEMDAERIGELPSHLD